MSESRKQFEAWHRSVVTGEPPHEKYNDGDYMNQHVQRYWLGWQASREALVIELPDAVEGARRYQQAEAAFAYKEGIDECRAIVASVLGETVSVPKELLI